MQPSENKREYTEAPLWYETTKDGNSQYLKGYKKKPVYLEAGYYLPMVFANKHKTEDKHPDSLLKLFKWDPMPAANEQFQQDIPF